MKPRPCQRDAANAVLRALRDGRGGLVRMPTRSGKSIALGMVLLDLYRRGALSKTIVVTSRTMLVDDLERTLWRLLDPAARAWSSAELERDGRDVRRARAQSSIVGRWDGHARRPALVTVTTYPSLSEAMAVEPVMLVADEAHRTKGKRVRALIERVPLRIGWSATPHGAQDREGLPFEAVLYDLTYADAVAQGVIVPWRPVWLDQPVGEADALDAAAGMVDDMGGPAAVGPILFTSPDLTTARAMAARLRDRGWTAEAAVPRRAGGEGYTRRGMRALIGRFERGDPQALITVDWLAEGVTIPALRAVALCAQPRGRIHLCQVAGRVMGTCAPDAWGEKREALIIDPCALLVQYRLEHPTRLGEMVHGRRKSVRRATREAVAEVAALPLAQQVAALDRWALAILGRCEAAAGKSVPRLGIGERALPADARAVGRLRRQLGAVRWLAGPEAHRVAIRAVADAGEMMALGVVRDLGEALALVRDRVARGQRATGRRWGAGWAVRVEGIELPGVVAPARSDG